MRKRPGLGMPIFRLWCGSGASTSPIDLFQTHNAPELFNGAKRVNRQKMSWL
jgi:hypothetical protein